VGQAPPDSPGAVAKVLEGALMSWAESFRIETPEQIDLDLEPAGPGSRFYAQLLDWLIQGSILFGVFLVVLLVVAATGQTPGANIGGPYLLAVVLAGVIVFLFGYDVYYEGCCNGQTPGKRIACIRVVRESGAPIDVRAALIRNVIGLADFLPSFYLLGGVVTMLTERGQRLGDLAAGTLVVRVRTGELRDELEQQILAQARDEYAFQAEHLARCQPEDANILRSYFSRSRELDPEARQELANRLRRVFLARTGYEPPQAILPADTDAFLASLYRDLKAYRAHL
jgi:uncharacterized RDD family membrane protein YckC